MKRLITGTILALPLVVTALATQANAAGISVQLGNSGHWENSSHGRVWVADHQENRAWTNDHQNNRVWVPGHWDNTRRNRVWVPGQYEYR